MHSDNATIQDVAPEQASFLVEEGSWISMSREGVSGPSSTFAEVRSASDEAFVVSISRTPPWMTEGLEVDGEVRHHAGLDRFASIVVNVSSGPMGDWVTLTQPERSWRYNRRASKRVPVSMRVRYSILDDEMHPGIEMSAQVDDLSVTGMRLTTDAPLAAGMAIVASVEIGHRYINAIGDVVGTGNNSMSGRPEARVAFRRLGDGERRVLTEVVASTAEIDKDQVIAPTLQRPGPPRRVVEAYSTAGQDRRR